MIDRIIVFITEKKKKKGILKEKQWIKKLRSKNENGKLTD